MRTLFDILFIIGVPALIAVSAATFDHYHLAAFRAGTVTVAP